MPLSILPFDQQPDLTDAVKRFNERMKTGGFGEFHFSERHSSKHFPKQPGRAVWMEYFLAVEPPEVRGGYIFKFQPFWSLGEPEHLTFLKLPVSEGIIQPDYVSLGIELLQDAEMRDSCLYALGMGGIKNKLPRILARMGWDVVEVPFFFKVCRASGFFRNIRVLRQSPVKRLLCDCLAWSGLGALGSWLMGLRSAAPSLNEVTVKLEAEFGEWSDAVWQSSNHEYHWLGQRNSATLNILYRTDDPRFYRLRVCRGAQTLGWALGLCTDMQDHKQFGNMRVASLVDGLAPMAEVPTVVAAAAAYLKSLRPNVIVSNQLHHRWQESLLKAGFRRGPSNFAQALTSAAAAKFKLKGARRDQMHCNRGDGDGPINL